MSKIDPSIFQISLKFKKSKKSGRGGGQAYFGKTPKFSRFLIMRSPLNVVVIFNVVNVNVNVNKCSPGAHEG